MDNLFEQIGNISKAHGYDILAEQVKDLKTVIRQLIDVGELDDLTFTDAADTAAFKKVLHKAKVLSLSASVPNGPKPVDYFLAANMNDEEVKNSIGNDVTKIDEP